MDNEINEQTIQSEANVPQEQTIQSEEQSIQSEEQSNLIEVVNASWQAKYSSMQNEYESRIAERDELIKQLITNGKIDDTDEGDDIVDKINAQRNFKKW